MGIKPLKPLVNVSVARWQIFRPLCSKVAAKSALVAAKSWVAAATKSDNKWQKSGRKIFVKTAIQRKFATSFRYLILKLVRSKRAQKIP